MTPTVQHRWRDLALCREVDPEMFFPDKGETAPDAKRVCGRCAVRAECLTAALTRREPYGIWGGTTPRARRALLRRRAPARRAGRAA